MFGNNFKKKLRKPPKKKRSTSERKLVVLNEEELIRQVFLRPVIYDRSLKGNRKTSLRNQCWKEISEAMDATIEECRTRWRSLRDTFTKQYKMCQRTDSKPPQKQSKWSFYDKMMFLIPHMEGFSSELLDEIDVNSEDAQSINCEPLPMNETTQEQQNETLTNMDTLEDNSKNVSQHTLTMASSLPQQMANNHNNSVFNVTASEKCTDLLDSDEKFLLSCAPTLRRLTARQNALARLKIQQLLFDIEFKDENI